MKIRYKFILLILSIFFTTTTLVYAKTPLPKGYLILVSLETYGESKFGAISKLEEAEYVFSSISKRYKKVGIAFLTLFYSDKDLETHVEIAKIAKKYGIDLWISSYKLVERVRAFGTIKPEYQAYVMQKDGKIVPAYYNGYPLFDVLNEDGVTWFLNQYRNKYLQKLKGLVNGYFFDEDVLIYLNTSRKDNNLRYDYWNNPTYSGAVLKKWQEYTIKNNIKYNGKIVDKFPVHDPKMASNGNGLTEYFPGYNVPDKIKPGQKFVDLPKPEGVWKHWFDFLSELYINNWINKIAKLANEVNSDDPNWYGTIYLGFMSWTLPYEKILDKNFTVPEINKWGAWGRQRGIDLEILSKSPNIDYIVCETYPPIKANIEYFIREFKRIVNNDSKFGLMLHRDDNRKIDLDEEEKRWELIKKYKPHLVVRYPLKSVLKNNKYYCEECEESFLKYLEEYREKIK
jgi:hypothetical protein